VKGNNPPRVPIEKVNNIIIIILRKSGKKII
jgi:hypothetical protein